MQIILQKEEVIIALYQLKNSLNSKNYPHIDKVWDWTDEMKWQYLLFCQGMQGRYVIFFQLMTRPQADSEQWVSKIFVDIYNLNVFLNTSWQRLNPEKWNEKLSFLTPDCFLSSLWNSFIISAGVKTWIWKLCLANVTFRHFKLGQDWLRVKKHSNIMLVGI